MQLESLQADFAAALFDARLAPTIAPAWSGGGRTVERLALYRSNLLATWAKTLGAAFPVVRAIVGAEFFASLVHAYGRAHPSSSGDLNHFGADFASFIASCERTRSLPYLADVAALEWAVHRAYFAADSKPLSRARIAAQSAHELMKATFVLHPACAWIDSEFPIARIWQAHQEHSGVALPDSLSHAECALIARPGWQAIVVPSSRGEIAALAALRAGATMDDAIGAGLQAHAEFDFARGLLRWLDLELLVE